jgi:hypothetical protein
VFDKLEGRYGSRLAAKAMKTFRRLRNDLAADLEADGRRAIDHED